MKAVRPLFVLLQYSDRRLKKVILNVTPDANFRSFYFSFACHSSPNIYISINTFILRIYLLQMPRKFGCNISTSLFYYYFRVYSLSSANPVSMITTCDYHDSVLEQCKPDATPIRKLEFASFCTWTLFSLIIAFYR